MFVFASCATPLCSCMVTQTLRTVVHGAECGGGGRSSTATPFTCTHSATAECRPWLPGKPHEDLVAVGVVTAVAHLGLDLGLLLHGLPVSLLVSPFFVGFSGIEGKCYRCESCRRRGAKIWPSRPTLGCACILQRTATVVSFKYVDVDPLLSSCHVCSSKRYFRFAAPFSS